MEPWSAEQVAALAPDAASVAAGHRLARPATWDGLGCDDAALWGLCRGSGSKPYQTVVDLGGPAYRCSCPSRKIPCKHTLGLLLLWSAGHVPGAEIAEFAREWLESRTERAAARATRAPRGPEGDEAASRRAERREERVASGLVELSRWLEDRVAAGLAGAEHEGYGPCDAMAARMVDAQAPGVAAWVRRLPGVPASGPGWPERLLGEYALLALLARAHERLESLPPGLVATVRSRVGYPVVAEVVREQPAVADRWMVLALRDTVEDRLTARRVWLWGERTGRPAMVLSFAHGGASPEAGLVPGTSVDADLHFHPAAAPLRAVLGRAEPPTAAFPVAGQSVGAALDGIAAVLAADPWTTTWPVLLAAAVPVRRGERWLVVDRAGAALPVAPGTQPWAALAVSGGRPVPQLVEWTPRGVLPLAVLDPASGRWVGCA